MGGGSALPPLPPHALAVPQIRKIAEISCRFFLMHCSPTVAASSLCIVAPQLQLLPYEFCPTVAALGQNY